MREELYAVVRGIPYGTVMSYGAVAEELGRIYGIITSGWMVGRMLSQMSTLERDQDPICPWWRVVNKQGVISALKLWKKWLDQIARLQAEGVKVIEGRVVI
jgi:alkylated DNA nucleotide flippase Atl1